MHKRTTITYKISDGNTVVTITNEIGKPKTIHVEEIDKSFDMTMKQAQRLRDILNEATKEGLL